MTVGRFLLITIGLIVVLIVWMIVKTIERATGAEPQGGRYFVFRFRTNPPHWAAKSGWMAGVAGPYFPGDEAFDAPAAGVFSKFESFETRSLEDHLAAMVSVSRAK